MVQVHGWAQVFYGKDSKTKRNETDIRLARCACVVSPTFAWKRNLQGRSVQVREAKQNNNEDALKKFPHQERGKKAPSVPPPADSHTDTHLSTRGGETGRKKDQDQLSDREQRTCRREAGSCVRSVAARTERVQEGDGLKGEYMVRNCGCSG